MLKVMKNIVKEEGSIFRLWRGNLSTVMRIFPYSAVQFGVYDSLKSFSDKKGLIKDQYLSNFINGSIAGVFALSSAYPLEIARTRMAMTGEMSKLSLSQIIKNTITKEGFFKGIYKGVLTGYVGIIVYKGVGFATFEYISDHKNSPVNKYFNYFISGAGGGLLGQIGKIFRLNFSILPI